MKLVIDTNNLVSGLFWNGPSAQLLEFAAQGKIKLVLSPELLAEFLDVISRPRFQDRIAAKGVTPLELTQKLGRDAALISPASLPLPPELRDPKDLPVLECAVAGQVDFIVTGDDDLLSMGTFQNIPILSARSILVKLL